MVKLKEIKPVTSMEHLYTVFKERKEWMGNNEEGDNNAIKDINQHVKKLAISSEYKGQKHFAAVIRHGELGPLKKGQDNPAKWDMPLSR